LDIITLSGYLLEFATEFGPALALFLILQAYAKRRGMEAPAKKFAKVAVFVLYVFLVLRVTGAGTRFDIGCYDELVRWEEVTLNLFDSEGAGTYLLNMLMLVPFGILVPYIWPKAKLGQTVLSGILFSFMIEASQLLNRRNSALDDLLMNTAGAAVGFGIYALARCIARRIPAKGGENKVALFFRPEPQVLKYEYLLYIAVMFAGYFLLWNWRGYIYLFQDHFYGL